MEIQLHGLPSAIAGTDLVESMMMDDERGRSGGRSIIPLPGTRRRSTVDWSVVKPDSAAAKLPITVVSLLRWCRSKMIKLVSSVLDWPSHKS